MTLSANSTVRTGSDVIESRNFSDLHGLHIGFVGNHTSRLSDGTFTHVALQNASGVHLEKLFSPEHGAFGREDREDIGDDVDAATGLPIFSLYGVSRKPTPEMLNGLDALVFEIQDVGARFYTYASTLILCLEAAHEAKIPLFLLDRPNPITGSNVEGPLADEDLLSFVACHTIPIRHGLTLGELATLVAHERGMSETLRVIKMEGWQRRMWWDETGVPWINPSPAMRSLETAIVYPGVCLLEQTNVSVGRGTDTPFLTVGAPWINSDNWVSAINDLGVDGATVAHQTFTPAFSKFENELCQGIQIQIIDCKRLNSVRLGLALIVALRNVHPGDFEPAGIQKLLANHSVFEAIERGCELDDIVGISEDSCNDWPNRIQQCLLYS